MMGNAGSVYLLAYGAMAAAVFFLMRTAFMNNKRLQKEEEEWKANEELIGSFSDREKAK